MAKRRRKHRVVICWDSGLHLGTTLQAMMILNLSKRHDAGQKETKNGNVRATYVLVRSNDVICRMFNKNRLRYQRCAASVYSKPE
jgi:hypothetical protein